MSGLGIGDALLVNRALQVIDGDLQFDVISRAIAEARAAQMPIRFVAKEDDLKQLVQDRREEVFVVKGINPLEDISANH